MLPFGGRAIRHRAIRPSIGEVLRWNAESTHTPFQMRVAVPSPAETRPWPRRGYRLPRRSGRGAWRVISPRALLRLPFGPDASFDAITGMTDHALPRLDPRLGLVEAIGHPAVRARRRGIVHNSFMRSRWRIDGRVVHNRIPNRRPPESQRRPAPTRPGIPPPGGFFYIGPVRRLLLDHLVRAHYRWGYRKTERRPTLSSRRNHGEQRLHFFLIDSAASIVWARSRSISSACRRINSAALIASSW